MILELLELSRQTGQPLGWCFVFAFGVAVSILYADRSAEDGETFSEACARFLSVGGES